MVVDPHRAEKELYQARICIRTKNGYMGQETGLQQWFRYCEDPGGIVAGSSTPIFV